MDSAAEPSQTSGPTGAGRDPQGDASPTPPGSGAAVQCFDAVVVGAGFAGLYALHRLRSQGLSVKVVEAGDGVGGTWYWNRYPGARCDFESVDYSYSFSEELQQNWAWSERYATQPEILRYLEHVADRFDLRDDIELGRRVCSAQHLPERGGWLITLDDDRTLRARYCVMATGALSAFNLPPIPEISEFTGHILHSARWRPPPDGLAGRRVGVIGTGSSGIQLIPELARTADQLIVFQRTANFCMPARNAPLTAEKVQTVKATYADRRARARVSYLGIPEQRSTHSALEVSDDQRRAAYEAAWQKGGANPLLQSFRDLVFDEAANDTAADFVRDKIKGIVTDPATAQALLPRGYPIGAKRVCAGTDYYETFNRENVSLVDLQTTPIEQFTPTGVRTTDTHHDLDAVVFATGFDAMTGALLAIDIVGREGISLRQAWEHGPQTYLGIAVAGFPNMFTVCGPQSPSVNSNMVMSIEQHIDWIADCIEWLDARDIAAIEPSQAAQDDWVDHVGKIAAGTLRVKGDSWYSGANIAGKPRVFMPYIGGLGTYRGTCDQVAAADYHGFQLTPASETASPPCR